MYDMGRANEDMRTLWSNSPSDQVIITQIFWWPIVTILAVSIGFRLLHLFWSIFRGKFTGHSRIFTSTDSSQLLFRVLFTPVHCLRYFGYLRTHFAPPFSSLSPLPLGQTLALLLYGIFVGFLSFYQVFIHDVSILERAAYRFGWMAITQIPLVYVTASKRSPFAHLLGTTHLEVNWLHRWISRIFIFAATLHGVFFATEYIRAGMFRDELKLMPMVRYGAVAWACLIWILLSSLAFVRNFGYRFFALNHSITVLLVLWLIYKHLQSLARKYIWAAVALIALDWITRLVLFFYHNFSADLQFGFRTEIEATGNEITILTLRGYRRRWKPGQHFYIWLPTIGPFESHPFTVSNIQSQLQNKGRNELQFVVQSKGGIAHRLRSHCSKNHEMDNVNWPRAFLSGPYGNTPNWHTYDTLVLISSSTGTSFTLPIMESILFSSITTPRSIRYLVTVPRLEILKPYLSRLEEAAILETNHIDLHIHVSVTGLEHRGRNTISRGGGNYMAVQDEDAHWSNINETTEQLHQFWKKYSTCNLISRQITLSNSEPEGLEDEMNGPCLSFTEGRTDIPEYIRKAIGKNSGKCIVGVCASRAVVATTSNAVSNLGYKKVFRDIWGCDTLSLHTENFSL